MKKIIELDGELVSIVIQLAVLAIIIVVKDCRSKFNWFFFLMLVGIAITMFSRSLDISSMGNYYYESFNNTLSFDHTIFMMYSHITGKVNIPFDVNLRIQNIGVALYLLAIFLFSFDIKRNIQWRGSSFLNLQLCLGGMFLLYYLCFYDPYIFINSISIVNGNAMSGSELFAIAVKTLHQINKWCVIGCIFYPVLMLFRYRMKHTLRFAKKQISLIIVCLLVMNTLFCCTLFAAPFTLPSNTYSVFILGSLDKTHMPADTLDFIIQTIVACLFVVIFAMLMHFKVGSPIKAFMNKRVKQNIIKMRDISIDSLHHQKNIFFSLNLLAKDAVLGDVPATNVECIKRIEQITSASLYRIAEEIDSIRALKYRFTNSNMSEIIDEAINKTHVPQNIVMVWNKENVDSEAATGFFDYYHLSRVFINVLNNAVEAIKMAGRENGRIQIQTVFLFQWIIVLITDNGIGIKGKSGRRFFLDKRSDKGEPFNWGLGLSYTYKVVNAHFGQCRVESQHEEYTSIYIMIPRIE